MPILHLKVWLKQGDAKKVLHEFYRKEVSTKAVVHARAAVAWSVKRTTLTQELLRIMLRCSPELEWKQVTPHLNDCMKRMQYSGYDQRFRSEVLRSALKGYREIERKDREGVQPRYREKNWMKGTREAQKRRKKSRWYKKGGYRSVVFVPATPKSELKKSYQEIIKKSKVPIKVVEMTGTTIQQKLQTSDPLSNKQCADSDRCMVCRSGGRNCRKEGTNYAITCDSCGALYAGESARNGYARGMEHESELRSRSSQSVLWRHTSLHHSNDVNPPTYSMKVTAVHGGDATLRQVTEGVTISNCIDNDMLINNKSEWMAGRGVVGCALTRT